MFKVFLILALAAFSLVFIRCKEDQITNPLVETCNVLPSTSFDLRPAWSPDGKTIAFISGKDFDDTGIYFVDTSGQNRSYFLNRPFISYLDWSPDGKWIVFHDAGQIFKVNIKDTIVQQLTFEGRNLEPCWSPDGDWIAFTKNDCNGPQTCGVWIMSVNGSQQRFIDDFGLFPYWYPNSKDIIYIRGDNQMWKYNIVTNIKTKINFNLQGAVCRYPKISSDSSKIIFWNQSTYGCRRIYSMNTNGSDLQNLTENIQVAQVSDWSPNGEFIVFTNVEVGNGRLWIMKKDGSQKRQLTF